MLVKNVWVLCARVRVFVCVSAFVRLCALGCVCAFVRLCAFVCVCVVADDDNDDKK